MSRRDISDGMTDIDAASSARERLAPGLPVGVTEATIAAVVHAFYARAREDTELGAIFNPAVADWDDHLTRLCDFWSSVMLMTGRYKGTPMTVHARLEALGPAHFDRWLELFAQTVREICTPEAAALFEDRARRIAQSLQMGIAVSRGELPPPHAR